MSNEVVISLKAYPHQRPVVDHFRKGGRHAFEVWHRRAGKDRVATFIESELAFKRVGLYWHSLPEYKQARRVIWDNITRDGHRLIDIYFPPAIVRKRHEQDMKIEFHNGSIWQLVGADQFDSLVGANPVHVTFSEFALQHPNAREFVRPILAENGGSELLITTPRGYNHAYRLWKIAQASDQWHTSLVTADDTGLIPPADLAVARSEMPDELYRQEFLCDWSAANVGSILGRYLEAAEREGRIMPDENLYDPTVETIVTADIGRRDKAAFWWWQCYSDGYALVHYDEASGLDAEEWCDRLGMDAPPVDELILPHDARVKTFQSKRSAVETMAMHFPRVRICPVTKKQDQINAGRRVMRHCRFGKGTDLGVEALRGWEYEYNHENRAFSVEPLHNWASHGADAYCVGAVMLERTVAPKPEAPPIIVPQAHYSFHLEDLYETVAGTGGRRV